MKWVCATVFAFMTLVTMSSVALDVKRVSLFKDGGEMSDALAWLKAATWTAMLYAFLLLTWESFQ